MRRGASAWIFNAGIVRPMVILRDGDYRLYRIADCSDTIVQLGKKGSIAIMGKQSRNRVALVYCHARSQEYRYSAAVDTLVVS